MDREGIDLVFDESSLNGPNRTVQTGVGRLQIRDKRRPFILAQAGVFRTGNLQAVIARVVQPLDSNHGPDVIQRAAAHDCDRAEIGQP